jgi:ketosteroid isomerase-like protein
VALDQLVARGAGGVRVHAEGSYSESAPERPVEAAGDIDRIDLVEADDASRAGVARPRQLAALRDTTRAVSHHNVEIVQSCYRVMEQRDWSVLPELLDPDFELDLSRNVFNPEVYRGHAGMERFATIVDDMWDDFQLVPIEFIDAGDKIVAAVTLRGKGKGSGVEVEMTTFTVFTVRDSKIVHALGGYRDRAEALEAAGVPGG